MKRLTKGPDYDQLPDVLFDKVQQDASMLTQEERAAAEARVLPIRESILPIMRGAMKGWT